MNMVMMMVVFVRHSLSNLAENIPSQQRANISLHSPPTHSRDIAPRRVDLRRNGTVRLTCCDLIQPLSLNTQPWLQLFSKNNRIHKQTK